MKHLPLMLFIVLSLAILLPSVAAGQQAPHQDPNEPRTLVEAPKPARDGPPPGFEKFDDRAARMHAKVYTDANEYAHAACPKAIKGADEYVGMVVMVCSPWEPVSPAKLTIDGKLIK
jgi:hypothetical protein